ncbi:MAG: sigma-70 family RNA polymerase sigma factor [Marmoricola sp.]
MTTLGSAENTGTTTATDRDELITSHLALVGHIVRETMSRVPGHVNRDDLTSAGMAALVQAGRAYDDTRGVPFARYAATRIRGAVLDELRGIDWASRSVRRRARDLEETRNRLSSTLGRPAGDAEVGSALGLSADEIAANRDDVARASIVSLSGIADTSLDELLPSGGLTPEQVVEHEERVTYLREAIVELPERLRVVVEQYFFAERPMAEIAAELGVTESRVSQIRAEALSLLKGALAFSLDPDLLEPERRPDGCAARRRTAYFAAVATRHGAGLRTAVPVLDATA